MINALTLTLNKKRNRINFKSKKMKLEKKPTSINELTGFVKGIIASYEYSTGLINPDKEMTFEIERKEFDNFFKVIFIWSTGIEIINDSPDPTLSEHRVKMQDDWFKWMDSESELKLVNYIDDVLCKIDNFYHE